MNVSKDNMNLPICLAIMDGYGLEDPGEGNAISQAAATVVPRLMGTCPSALLEASGEAVGLPAGQMGNSEVGHLNIGAGRVVFQELTRINRACADGSLASNHVLGEAFAQATNEGAALHLMGLLSDGGVHSSNAHLYALIRAACKAGVRDIRVHCFMDGRDVPPSSGAGYVEELEAELADVRAGHSGVDARVVSVMGRYYAMDRDNRWERVERAYNTLVLAEGFMQGVSPVEVMKASYEGGVTDEFVEPVCFDERGVRDGDAVVFFNFRPDRAREITRAFVDADFAGFERKRTVDVSYVCLTEYDPTIEAPVAFAKEFPQNVLADVLAEAGLRQYHIAETEKYAHVTFFLNGGVEQPKAGEFRQLIPSPKVATYDLQPEMSAPAVAEQLVSAIDRGEADVYIVNFANCDMVGHTGVIPAAIKAVETVDVCIGKVEEAIRRAGGAMLLTADHGNADRMLAADGSPHTAHTTAKVPFVLIDHTGLNRQFSRGEGALCDIAPTLLELIGISAPLEMTGSSFLA